MQHRCIILQLIDPSSAAQEADVPEQNSKRQPLTPRTEKCAWRGKATPSNGTIFRCRTCHIRQSRGLLLHATTWRYCGSVGDTLFWSALYVTPSLQGPSCSPVMDVCMGGTDRVVQGSSYLVGKSGEQWVSQVGLCSNLRCYTGGYRCID